MKPQIFKNALTYSLPDMERVEVQNVVYRYIDNTALTMDIYYHEFKINS